MVKLQNSKIKNLLVSLLVFSNFMVFLSAFLLFELHVFLLILCSHIFVILLCVFYFQNYNIPKSYNNINLLSVSSVFERSIKFALIASGVLFVTLILMKELISRFFDFSNLFYPVFFMLLMSLFSVYVVYIHFFNFIINNSIGVCRIIAVLISSFVFKFVMVTTAHFGVMALDDYSDFVPHYIFNMRYPAGYSMVFMFYACAVCADCGVVFSFSRKKE